MGKKSDHRANRARTFLSRLARDVRGNTLAIMAAALFPLAGMVGGGVDLSRLYIVKTRLQHACDAGALAGRKAMGGGAWNQDSYAPKKMAERFFETNVNDNLYGATNVSKTFTENAGKVEGKASAKVPMTLMRIFGNTTETLNVNCDAEMRLPNTDVMFVLDTTGSMADKAVSSDPDTKIQSLKTAVKCFYEIVSRNDTSANCATGTPSGGLSNQVQVRFGFMPYATNVNVGKLLPVDFLADSWDYQSRKLAGHGWSDWSWQSGYYVSGSSCKSAPSNTPSRQYEYRNEWYNGNRVCMLYRRDWLPQWQYKKQNIDISDLKDGLKWHDSFQWPIADDGGNRTIKWDGCIEERATVKRTTYDPIPSGANDLDIDLVPGKDKSTLWGPALPDLIYARTVQTSWDQLNDATVDVTTANYYNSVPYYCPTEARKLQQWPSASTFESYINSLTPSGNTYHDIGLLWGARFMSPTGIFASENATTPKGGEIERHLIFMTDGDTNTSNLDYAAYGIPWFDRRQTDKKNPPTNGELNDQVNARFTALCTAIKNKNITLWVISFGSGSNSTTEQRLENCASSGKYFTARDSAALQKTFKQIADQISQLRLTQ